ncbi:hypothetical protein V6Z11_D13G005100 [Gossypium hirsutum]
MAERGKEDGLHMNHPSTTLVSDTWISIYGHDLQEPFKFLRKLRQTDCTRCYNQTVQTEQSRPLTETLWANSRAAPLINRNTRLLSQCPIESYRGHSTAPPYLDLDNQTT